MLHQSDAGLNRLLNDRLTASSSVLFYLSQLTLPGKQSSALTFACGFGTSYRLEKSALTEVCILSPHRDDAAFSCGLIMQSLLTAGIRVLVITICTRSSYAPYLSASPPSALPDVTNLRKQEDDAFFKELTVRADRSLVQTIDLEWEDAPERWNMHADDTLRPHELKTEEVNSLREELRSRPSADLVLAPLALGGHVDHQLVRNAALLSIPTDLLALYEDLPYAARAVQLAARMNTVSGNEEPIRGALILENWSCRDFPRNPLATVGRKQRYALCYPSQIDEATAQEIGAYSDALGGRERLHGPIPVLDRIDELFHQ